MSDENKLNKYVTEEELAAYFRALADAIEKGGKDEFACVDDFKKIKIGVKREYGQIALKAKFKSTTPYSLPEAEDCGTVMDGKPKYKTLKKRMRSSFKVLIKMIHDGTTPPPEAVEAFLADSALMVTYPGYGDEYYDHYTKACAEFREAYAARDLDRMHVAVDALVHEKSRCHAKYD